MSSESPDRDGAEALLGAAVMLMLQSGNADCKEFARGIPVEFKTLDGAPRAALQSRPNAPIPAATEPRQMIEGRDYYQTGPYRVPMQPAVTQRAPATESSERRDGHKALRVRDGKMETFDPHPETAPSPSAVEAVEKAAEICAKVELERVEFVEQLNARGMLSGAREETETAKGAGICKARILAYRDKLKEGL